MLEYCTNYLLTEGGPVFKNGRVENHFDVLSETPSSYRPPAKTGSISGFKNSTILHPITICEWER